MYKDILVAYDGSILSWKALVAAKFQAKLQDDSQVHVITIIEKPKSDSKDESTADVTQELENKFQPQMEKIEEEFEKNKISAKMKIVVAEDDESPGSLIASYASEHNNDLIVMGSRGLGDETKVYLGSVSNEVVQKAKCPVLVIKE